MHLHCRCGSAQRESHHRRNLDSRILQKMSSGGDTRPIDAHCLELWDHSDAPGVRSEWSQKQSTQEAGVEGAREKQKTDIPPCGPSLPGTAREYRPLQGVVGNTSVRGSSKEGKRERERERETERDG